MIDGTKLPYAKTEISIEKSKIQTNELLKKFGVSGIQWTWLDNMEVLRFIHTFEVEGVKHQMGYEIQIPEMGIKRGRAYETRLERNDRQAYRIVWHVLKARFVAVESGLKTFEEEFLSDIIYKLPDGSMKKIGDVMLKKLTDSAGVGWKEVDLLE